MPPDLRVRHGIGRGEIGLDVEERRVVEAVEADDRRACCRRCATAAPPRRRSGSAAPASAARKCRGARRNGAATLHHQIAPRLVHPIEQQHVADAVEAGQPLRPSADRARRCRPRPIGARSSGNPRAAAMACGCGRYNRARRRTLPAARPRLRPRAGRTARRPTAFIARRIFGLGRLDHAANWHALPSAARVRSLAEQAPRGHIPLLLQPDQAWDLAPSLNDIKISLYGMKWPDSKP